MLEGFCGSGAWGMDMKNLFSQMTPLAGELFTKEPGCQSAWKGASSILALCKLFKHLVPRERSQERGCLALLSGCAEEVEGRRSQPWQGQQECVVGMAVPLLSPKSLC